ncbi:MAG TPA: hypothetical protein VE819_07135 [Steroidobacteraceae bacterium]|jgi:hypothetical protein|nr:hypothetical protein [Steroidobacteraceae bacterium]
MKRLAELETRRRALIARCEAQRAELSWRLAQLSPRRWTGALAGGLAASGAGRVREHGRHPLAWLVAAAALLLLRRPRQALSMLARARTALSLVTRAAQILTVVGGLRRARQR